MMIKEDVKAIQGCSDGVYALQLVDSQDYRVSRCYSDSGLDNVVSELGGVYWFGEDDRNSLQSLAESVCYFGFDGEAACLPQEMAPSKPEFMCDLLEYNFIQVLTDADVSKTVGVDPELGAILSANGDVLLVVSSDGHILTSSWEKEEFSDFLYEEYGFSYEEKGGFIEYGWNDVSKKEIKDEALSFYEAAYTAVEACDDRVVALAEALKAKYSVSCNEVPLRSRR